MGTTREKVRSDTYIHQGMGSRSSLPLQQRKKNTCSLKTFIPTGSRGKGQATVVRGRLRLKSKDSFGPLGNRGLWARSSKRKQKPS